MTKGEIIAVTGKGGTGKTLISTLLIKFLSERERILAIDADPATSLPSALGVRVQKTLGDVREEIAAPSRIPGADLPIDVLLEHKIDEIMVRTPRFSLIAMGRSEGPGCYCLINDMLRHFIDKLSGRFSKVVVDCEAGLEHLSRRTVRDVSTLLVVSDPTIRGLETAKSIKNIAEKLQIKFDRICLVLNKVTSELDALEGKIKDTGLELVGTIPEDEVVKEFDFVGKPLIELPDDSKAVAAVCDIVNACFR